MREVTLNYRDEQLLMEILSEGVRARRVNEAQHREALRILNMVRRADVVYFK